MEEEGLLNIQGQIMEEGSQPKAFSSFSDSTLILIGCLKRQFLKTQKEFPHGPDDEIAIEHAHRLTWMNE